MQHQNDREIRDVFDVGLVLKALTSVLEVGSGILVMFVSPTAVLRITEFATEGVIVRDPDDFVANYLRATAHTFAIHSHYLLGGYLILRGVLTFTLIILVLRGVILAYPFFILTLGLFGSYEAYLGILTHNVFLGFIALLDTALILLAAHDYNKRRTHSSRT